MLCYIYTCRHIRGCILIVKFFFILIVLAMESQAEALGQLTTDDLEGKVKSHSLVYVPFHV